MYVPHRYSGNNSLNFLSINWCNYFCPSHHFVMVLFVLCIFTEYEYSIISMDQNYVSLYINLSYDDRFLPGISDPGSRPNTLFAGLAMTPDRPFPLAGDDIRDLSLIAPWIPWSFAMPHRRRVIAGIHCKISLHAGTTNSILTQHFGDSL